MVGKIHSSSGGCGGAIEYNFSKIEKDKGELLTSNVLFIDKNDLKKQFENVHNLNTRVKNKRVHITLNFNPEDKILENEEYTSIAQDYIKQMGYDNSPFCVFLHKDKKHTHMHIVSSSVDYDGIKIKEWKNADRSFQTCRRIEKDYDLLPLDISKEQINRSKISLGQYSSYGFIVQNTIRGLHKQSNGYDKVKDILNIDLYNNIVKKNMSNHDIIKSIGNDKYIQLYSLLDSEKLLNKPLWVLLSNKLDKVLNNSESMNDYFAKIKKMGISYHIHESPKGQYLVYGFNDLNFHKKDTTLSGRFRYHNIKKKFNQDLNILPFAKQKMYVKEKVQAVLNQDHIRCENIYALKQVLAKENIDIIYHTNKSGLFGLSFKMQGDNTNIIKGSSIGASLSNVTKNLAFKNKTSSENILSPVSHNKENINKFASNGGGRGGGLGKRIIDDPHDERDEAEEKQRRKKDMGM